MRLRACVLACALTMLGSFFAAGSASAAPHQNRNLTIAAEPNPILAGEGVVIYGRLLGSDNGNELIRLYHHVVRSAMGFTRVATTRTDSSGYYEFLRPDGLIYTNRDWFVRGPDGSHSRTIRERVAALLTLNPPTNSGDTSHPIVFTGHVTPRHLFEQVFLQRQDGSSDDWKTVAHGLILPGSNYFLVHRFRFPGSYNVRAVFRGDARNIRSVSDTVNVVIQQTQVPGFTISTSAPIVGYGGSTTISGVLDQPQSTTPESNTIVQLWGKTPDHQYVVLADKPTASDGSYSFTQSGLTTNATYFVATMPLPHSPRQHTARLFEGVRDALTMQASSSSAETGQTVTFTGTVLPDEAGRMIYLQKRGKDGDFHTVELGIVQPSSTFRFTWTMGSPGPYEFRARITSDENNVGGASTPVNVTATPAPASSLPPAS